MTANMVVVLTALNLEYEAMWSRLVDPRVWTHERGTRFELGTLRGRDCQIALALTGKGNQRAAVLAERAIHEFDPAAVLFVGVAGALEEKVPLGDVVVATHVYAYHGGTSEDDGLKARPRVWEADHGISQIAEHVARLGDWWGHESSRRGRPGVHFGSIAAGELVQNSRTSYEAEWIRRHYNDALAVEMESAGVAQAGHLNGSPVGIVRGISDKADGTKNTDSDGTWQPQAADNAAAFAARLAEELTNEGQNSPMQYRDKAKTEDVVTNIAHAPVGIQAKEVSHSNVSMTTSAVASVPLDVAAELAVVRQQLDHARATGVFDDATYEAAREQLDLAGEALEDDVPERNSRFVLALKRLRGLIEEAAEVASKVAAIITAVSGLS